MFSGDPFPRAVPRGMHARTAADCHPTETATRGHGMTRARLTVSVPAGTWRGDVSRDHPETRLRTVALAGDGETADEDRREGDRPLGEARQHEDRHPVGGIRPDERRRQPHDAGGGDEPDQRRQRPHERRATQRREFLAGDRQYVHAGPSGTGVVAPEASGASSSSTASVTCVRVRMPYRRGTRTVCGRSCDLSVPKASVADGDGCDEPERQHAGQQQAVRPRDDPERAVRARGVSPLEVVVPLHR